MNQETNRILWKLVSMEIQADAFDDQDHVQKTRDLWTRTNRLRAWCWLNSEWHATTFASNFQLDLSTCNSICIIMNEGRQPVMNEGQDFLRLFA